jgi:YVTN family beta-propeller protein
MKLFNIRHFLMLGFLLAFFCGSLAAEADSALKLYVSLFRQNSVAVVDTATNQVLKRIPVAAGPSGMVLTRDDRRLYIASERSSTLSVVDTATDTVKETVEVGASPQGLALTPDGKTLLVAVFGKNQLLFLSTADNTVTKAVTVQKPHSIALAPDGKSAVVASQDTAHPGLVIVDLDSQAEVGSIPLETEPRALTMGPGGERLYFTLVGSNSVQVLDLATKELVHTIPVDDSPHLALFTRDEDSALIVCRGSGSLVFFDPDTDAVTGRVKVGDLPYWVTANGVDAWVTNENSNSISVVDLYAQTVTATIPLAGGPRELVVQQKEH